MAANDIKYKHWCPVLFARCEYLAQSFCMKEIIAVLDILASGQSVETE